MTEFKEKRAWWPKRDNARFYVAVRGEPRADGRVLEVDFCVFEVTGWEVTGSGGVALPPSCERFSENGIPPVPMFEGMCACDGCMQWESQFHWHYDDVVSLGCLDGGLLCARQLAREVMGASWYTDLEREPAIAYEPCTDDPKLIGVVHPWEASAE